VTPTGHILAEGAGPDGGGGGVDLSAAGSILVQPAGIVSARSNGGQGCGGMVCIDADIGMTNSGMIDASGGLGGGTVDISSSGNITLGGTVTLAAVTDGGFAGDMTAEAGFDGAGALSISGTIDVTGGHCSDVNGCGDGGTTDLSGCDVTLTPTGHILAVAPNAGQNRLTAREQLTVAGEVNASAIGAGVAGSNIFEHPSRKPPVVTGVVTPPATVTAFATCTGPLQPLCLDPCPTCGNGVVEWPETCDDVAGTPLNCDGCTRFCRLENCNDVNACTSDSCDPTLGCRHVAVPDGPPAPTGSPAPATSDAPLACASPACGRTATTATPVRRTRASSRRAARTRRSRRGHPAPTATRVPRETPATGRVPVIRPARSSATTARSAPSTRATP